MRRTFLRLYWAAEKILTPGLVYSQTKYEEVLGGMVKPATRWLDVGCGHQVLPPWRLDREREIVRRAARVSGVDPDGKAICKHETIHDVRRGTAEHLPFPDGSFDLVTANMVAEHLKMPERALAEIARVLATGGALLIHTPNIYGHQVALARPVPHAIRRVLARVLDGRTEDDVYPVYYRANSMKTIRELALPQFRMAEASTEIPSTAIFAVVLPIALVELCWIRLTQTKRFGGLRSKFAGDARQER